MPLQLDQLTAQERELLRLLAQGHTAKTIANLTGLSVNIVNERLRSARRKTGAVSSRELARHLRAQDHKTPQETRANFFGLGNDHPDRHPLKTGPATGAGSANFWRATMFVGLILAAGIAGVATSTPELQIPARRDPISVGAPVRATGQEWRGMSGANTLGVAFLTPNPSNSFTFIPKVVLFCEGLSITAVVRGFTPQDSWPQPAMEMRIGDAVRTGLPQVAAAPDTAALQYSFAISDEILEPLAQGEPITFTFDGQTIQAPAISEPERSRFTRACGALVHPGMRRRDAAGDRVY